MDVQTGGLWVCSVDAFFQSVGFRLVLYVVMPHDRGPADGRLVGSFWLLACILLCFAFCVAVLCFLLCFLLLLLLLRLCLRLLQLLLYAVVPCGAVRYGALPREVMIASFPVGLLVLLVCSGFRFFAVV